MGGSSWSDDFYRDRAADRAARGVDTFHYTTSMAHAAPADKRVHDKLNPRGVTRESRDSDAHPRSNAIGVVFDVTGSMGAIPKRLQLKLPQLMALLLSKGYIEDPQILFGGVGDATCDCASLQIGQFESGVEMDDDLTKLWLEGGGGGQMTESYQNALYFFARHTSIDCFEKRQRRGYLFLIGDETAYPEVDPDEVAELMGDALKEPIALASIVREAQRLYNVFFIIPRGASYGQDSRIPEYWKRVLGENVIMLDEPEAVCETIAATIGLCEGAVDLDGAAAHLRDHGATDGSVRAVTTALAHVATSGAIAQADLAPGTSAGVERL